MKNKNLKKSRISKLRNGKVKGIGFFESITLKFIGYLDGTRNLPRKCSDGQWLSPHLDREIRSYDEFSSQMWGQLQIEKEEAYARLSTLINSIAYTKSELESARAELKNAFSYEESLKPDYKFGEDKLTETQMITRRANESDKRLGIFRSEVSALRSKLSSEVNEFMTLYNTLVEDNNSVKMVCVRVKDHLFQRMNVYWNSALRKHSEKTNMPVFPAVEVGYRAEVEYMKLHKELLEKAEKLSRNLSKDETEAT